MSSSQKSRETATQVQDIGVLVEEVENRNWEVIQEIADEAFALHS